jgi:LacI family transcriptional regulator
MSYSGISLFSFCMDNKRVALLIETSSSWGQQIIAGIGDYIRSHGRWILYLDHRGTYEKQTVPVGWEGDGIIARVTSPVLVQHVRMNHVPCVNVSTIRVPGASIQHVNTSEIRVAEIAAKVLLSTGFQHFGYFGPPAREFYTDQILRDFRELLKQAGHSLSVHNPDRVLRSDTDPHLDLVELGNWIESLGKPAAILCWNALGAHRVVEAAVWKNLRVPEQISVLGADEDQLTSELSMPQITCINQAPRKLGFMAAAELDRLFQGGAVGDPVLLEPEGVIYRQSLISAPRADPLVEEAIRLIHENSTRDYSISKLLKALTVSRRTLELHFRQSLGRTLATEFRMVRLKEAQRLLAESDLQIKEVARRSGLKNPEQLQRLIRITTSLTPLQYRQAYRRQPTLGTPPPPMLPMHDRMVE